MSERDEEPAGNALLAELKGEISANGPIPVARYMAACLTHPRYGYYRRAEAIGADGDFVTAPEISQIFGELIGIWVAAAWQQLGEPPTLRLVELGPGRGTMMRDCLRALRVVPGLRERVQVVLVEISERLREAQQVTLQTDSSGVAWVSDLDTLTSDTSSCPAIVLANEFFDALPVTQFIRCREGWMERAVGVDASGRLTFTTVAIDGSPPAGIDAQDGDILETRQPALCAGTPSLQDTFAALSVAHPTILLAIDYGYGGPAVGDTLQAMRAQAYGDILETPGEQDLTAHVDFSGLGAVLADAGLTIDGPLSQANFLSGIGFSARLSRLLAGKDARQANIIETSAHRLVAEPGMGSHFRVLAARSRHVPPLAPFPPAQTGPIRG